MQQPSSVHMNVMFPDPYILFSDVLFYCIVLIKTPFKKTNLKSNLYSDLLNKKYQLVILYFF